MSSPIWNVENPLDIRQLIGYITSYAQRSATCVVKLAAALNAVAVWMMIRSGRFAARTVSRIGVRGSSLSRTIPLDFSRSLGYITVYEKRNDLPRQDYTVHRLRTGYDA